MTSIFCRRILFVLLFLCSVAAKENGVIEIYPAWIINPTLFYLNEKSEYYLTYSPFFQRHILTILNENGIPAIPSLYNSAIQNGYYPRNLDDLQVLLSKEVPPPYNSYIILTEQFRIHPKVLLKKDLVIVRISRFS